MSQLGQSRLSYPRITGPWYSGSNLAQDAKEAQHTHTHTHTHIYILCDGVINGEMLIAKERGEEKLVGLMT